MSDNKNSKAYQIRYKINLVPSIGMYIDVSESKDYRRVREIINP